MFGTSWLIFKKKKDINQGREEGRQKKKLWS